MKTGGIKKGAKIIVKIVDDDDNTILSWRPGNNNVALGIRKACDIACNKLGMQEELKQQRIVLQDKPEMDFDLPGDRTRA